MQVFDKSEKSKICTRRFALDGIDRLCYSKARPHNGFAVIAQVAEHVIGNDEVGSSNLPNSSIKQK